MSASLHRAARWTAVAIAFTGTAWVTYGGTGHLFPRAQEYLADKGFDPGAVYHLTDTTADIRIRNPLTRAGFWHSYFDFLANLGDFKLLGPETDSTQIFLSKRVANIFGVYMANIPEDGKTQRDDLAWMTWISTKLIEIDPLSKNELTLIRVLHEIRHTSSNNRSLPDRYSKEADAEIGAIDEGSRILNRPDLVEVMLYKSALSLSGEHNMSLLMEAHYNNQPTLSEGETEDANRDMFDSIRQAHKNNPVPYFDRSWAKGLDDSSIGFGLSVEEHYRLMNKPNTLSPLAKRRTQLFLQGCEYYMPTFTRNIRDYISTTTHAPQPRALPQSF